MCDLHYKQGYKYQVANTHTVQTPIKGYTVDHHLFHLSEDGRLTLMRGFAWDGATFFPDFKSILRSSAYHDCFYQMIAAGLLPMEVKKPVDEFLRYICEEDGMIRITARLVYRGVRLNPRPDKNPVLTVP